MPEPTVHYPACAGRSHVVPCGSSGAHPGMDVYHPDGDWVKAECICEALQEHLIDRPLDVGDYVSFRTPEGPKRVVITSILLQSRAEQDFTRVSAAGSITILPVGAPKIDQTVTVSLDVVDL